VREGCRGSSRDYLESICMQLPEKDCLPAIEDSTKCGEDEFSCGDGQCIPGLLLCDNQYHCSNGADELECMEHCSNEVPAECADVVPYTTYPNKLFMLNGTAQYTQFSDNITAALMNCSGLDELSTRWGVCNIMFPRCLLGFELQLCRETCLSGIVSYCQEVDSLAYLTQICEQLPDEKCLPSPYSYGGGVLVSQAIHNVPTLTIITSITSITYYLYNHLIL